MAVLEGEIHLVDHLRNERKLFRRADRAADACRFGRRCLLPGIDVFERLCAIELLKSVVNVDFEAGAFKTFEGVDCDLGSFVEDAAVERGVVPPLRRNFTECAHFSSFV